MPYADPQEHKAAQREVQFDRSRAPALMRALLIWHKYRNTDDGRHLLARLTQMAHGERLWRQKQGMDDLELGRWPARRERQLLQELGNWERQQGSEK